MIYFIIQLGNRHKLPVPFNLMRVILVLFFAMILTDYIVPQTPYYSPGYPKIVDSQRSPFQKGGIPLIADIDRDGQKEIIFFTVDIYGSNLPLLQVMKSDGTNFSNFPKSYNELILCIASGDLDGKANLEIVSRTTNSINVLDKDGNTFPGFPIQYSDGDVYPFKPVNVFDLDNDGTLEIIAGKKNEIAVFNFNGTIRAGWPRYIAGIFQTNPAIGDIDNDGLAEIIVPTLKILSGTVDSSCIRIFKSNGENFSSAWPVYSDSGYYNWGASPTIIINKNNSDSTAIVMSTRTNANVGGISKNRLTKYNINAEIVDVGYNSVLNGLGTLVAGDLDMNGTIEFANGNQGNPTSLSLYSSRMLKLSGWPNEGVGEHWATPVIGKLTSNTEFNIAANTWTAISPSGYGYIHAYSKDGSPLSWSPLRPIGLVNAVSLGEINNDGSVDIVALSTQTDRETYLHVWTIPGIPFSHANFPWPQYGHDRYRTNQHGFIPPDEPVGIQPINTNVPAAFNLHQNFPNPFNPATSIKFDIAKKGNVKLVVFDILGRELSTLINESLNPGTYQVSFDGSGLSSGIYLCRLQS